MNSFLQRCPKRKLLVITATTLLGIMSMAHVKKAKIATSPPSVRQVVEQKTTRCHHRIDFLESLGSDEQWHRGGWAVRQLCRRPLDTLFFVHTAPDHWERRIHLRSTVFEEAARIAFNWTGVFVMGKHEDPLVNLWAELEAEVMGDVVMFPYNDTFFTVLYKFVGGMRWVAEYCPNVKNIVKIDDDVDAQPFLLRRYLDENLPLGKGSIHCYTLVNGKVHRRPESPYCVPEGELAIDSYPMYCSGSAMIMTMDTMRKLLGASKLVKGYAIDDAFVTGHLTLLANVGHQDFNTRMGADVFEESLDDIIAGKVIFVREYSTYGNTVGRRVQWGLMLWRHTMQARGRQTFNMSYRFADRMYRQHFPTTRHALEEGLHLPSRE